MIVNDLWQQFGQLKYDDIPESTRKVAKQCLLDWMACVIAGSGEPLAEILRAEFSSQEGPCSVIGKDIKTSPQAAAMINGATGHALDFDDTHSVMGGHPTVPIAPAIWAVAEETGASGQALLTALVAGLESECRLGTLIGTQHYAKGWHVTSTIGIFGAVVGVAHLLGLTENQFGNAFGLAASQASGLKSNFGTMTKPFHAGHAAERGLLSARLAQRGFTANPDSFDGNQGLVSAAGNGSMRDEQYADLADQWLIERTLFKYNAACYLTHASIEGLKQLGEAAVEANCESIDLLVHPSLLNVCGIENPTTGLEAKFSLRANAALTVMGYDTTDPATYSDETVQTTGVQSTLQKVKVLTDKSLTGTQSKVTFHGCDGTSYDQFYDSGIPDSNLDNQQSRLEAKFDRLVTPDCGVDAGLLKQHIMAIESSGIVTF
ncbi:MAG TPA: MmgE/PrpD family protein [Pseudomonadales bacterium]|jgi:2-methylcitrate dehydratase PrpD|nr:MmgE/PrpD family protein [Pseudomonadales bacterium]HJL60480.1 MmgE/PrpD family protein [Pseudomonadales bacterium]|tara:strand:- start:17 stop:1315 length:1299 start_codon:yes stop_codon:yes gene_type:complete